MLCAESVAPSTPADANTKLVWQLLVDQVEPSTVTAAELIADLGLTGSQSDWASRKCSGIQEISSVLDAAQCAALRGAVDMAQLSGTDGTDDTIDGWPDCQLDLTGAALSDLIGELAVEKLASLAAAWHDTSMNGSQVVSGIAVRRWQQAPGPPLPHYIFVRRYTAETRHWCPFHQGVCPPR